MSALLSNILTQVFITLIAVSGVYVLTGLTGMFSLGQAAFMAIGAYASGLLVIRAHIPFALACIIAVAMATGIGFLIGYPVVRLRRDYISLVTLGFGEAIAALLNRMTLPRRYVGNCDRQVSGALQPGALVSCQQIPRSPDYERI